MKKYWKADSVGWMSISCGSTWDLIRSLKLKVILTMKMSTVLNKPFSGFGEKHWHCSLLAIERK